MPENKTLQKQMFQFPALQAFTNIAYNTQCTKNLLKLFQHTFITRPFPEYLKWTLIIIQNSFFSTFIIRVLSTRRQNDLEKNKCKFSEVLLDTSLYIYKTTDKTSELRNLKCILLSKVSSNLWLTTLPRIPDKFKNKGKLVTLKLDKVNLQQTKLFQFPTIKKVKVKHQWKDSWKKELQFLSPSYTLESAFHFAKAILLKQYVSIFRNSKTSWQRKHCNTICIPVTLNLHLVYTRRVSAKLEHLAEASRCLALRRNLK